MDYRVPLPLRLHNQALLNNSNGQLGIRVKNREEPIPGKLVMDGYQVEISDVYGVIKTEDIERLTPP